MLSLRASIGVGVALLALSACGQQPSAPKSDTSGQPTATAEPTAAAGADNATASAKPAAITADNVDTVDGTKFASFTGTADAGAKVFVACKTCHAIEPGKNMVGPSLHGLLGRVSGSVAGYSYSAANKVSGITWNNEKLFQYLETPQRVIVGTKMSYTGVKDAQKRADLIAYLNTLK
jgi:cytochrome c